MTLINDLLYRATQLMPQYQTARRQLEAIDVTTTLSTPQNHAPKGFTLLERRETDHYTVEQVVEDGIERITYTPKTPRHETPIFMGHGMWHGAWCWEHWQALFAEWGWRSISMSLPGHGQSPKQKDTTEITLDYYLAFIRDEIAKLERPPVYMGHSMGGALAQWYMRYVTDHLPAVVLVGAWTPTDMPYYATRLMIGLDPIGLVLMSQAREATPWIRTPGHAYRFLANEQCLYTPEELQAKLVPESVMVLMQHDHQFFEPLRDPRAPILYVGGEKDAVLPPNLGMMTADFYGADFMLVPDCAHNIMMDARYAESASRIHRWLEGQGIA